MKGLLSLVMVALLVLPSCNKSVTAPSNPLDAPVISFFSADALSVKVGASVILRWDVSGTTADVRIDPMVGNVPLVGSATLILSATTTFTLNARAVSGASAQRVLTVVVTP